MTSTSWDPSSPRRPPAPGSRRRAPGPRSRRHRLTPPRELREAGLSPRKALGQHFLTSERALRRIAEACDLSPATNVIEIGAGLGGLTGELSAHAAHVVAVELDGGLATYLRQRFADTNVAVVQGDALEIDPVVALAKARASPPYVVAGNLPYNVAQPLLRHFLEARPPPERLVVMVQSEVADSIVARPGGMSLLSVSVQLYGEPRLLFRVPASAFYPPPKVRSAVVRIDVAPHLRAGVRNIEAFFRVARAGFGTKRKQLRNALAHGLGIDAATAAGLLAAAAIDPTLRAQALSLEQWAALTRAWVAAGRPESEG